MRYGYWMPVFGGWLRNVEDEGMAPTWEYNKRLAQRSEQIGFDLSLVAELNLNDIKGEEAPSLDAWSTSAALMAATQKLELMRAVRPVIYAGGESETAKNLIAKMCDAYVMHGDPPERIAEKIRDMAARREKFGLPPMIYGVAAYSIVRNTEAEAKAELARITDVKQSAAGYNNYQQWLAGTQLEQRVSLE